MQNFLKKFGAIVIAILAATCMAIFAVACGDGEDTPGNDDGYATESFTVIVQYEDGTPIDGTKHSSGESWINDALWPTMSMPAACIQIQFCVVKADGTLGSCANPVNVGEDGKAEIPLTGEKGLFTAAETLGSSMFELHICNVMGYGYDKGENNSAYGRYNVNEMPKEITVKLQLAA